MTTRGDADYLSIGPGQSVVLCDILGAGVIRHVWCTMAAPRNPGIGHGIVKNLAIGGVMVPAADGDHVTPLRYVRCWCSPHARNAT